MKVSLVEPDGQFPFIVEFSHVKQHFTKKAAIELENKLRLALDELELNQAMRESANDHN
jgi:hypothetical protein